MAIYAIALMITPIQAFAQDGTDDLVPDNNMARWAFLIGIFLPMGIATVNQANWTRKLKGAVTFACCLLAALGTAYFAGELDGNDIASSFLIILVMATLTYRIYWGPEASGIASDWEKTTTINKQPAT